MKIIVEQKGARKEVTDQQLLEIQSNPDVQVILIQETADERIYKVLDRLLG